MRTRLDKVFGECAKCISRKLHQIPLIETGDNLIDSFLASFSPANLCDSCLFNCPTPFNWAYKCSLKEVYLQGWGREGNLGSRDTLLKSLCLSSGEAL